MKNDHTKLYPVLYSRASSGKVICWWIEQDGSKYRTLHGELDGAIIISEWTIAEPTNVGRANQRNAVQQATFEVDAKYKKQLKSGGYWNDIKDVDTQRFFQVMLADGYEKRREKIDWSKGVGVQIKYNGGRIVVNSSGLWTRKGEKIVSVPHIEEALQPFFSKFPEAVLDGEGFNYGLRERLCDIMSLLRKTKNITKEDLQKSKELIRYYVYDGFGFGAKQTDGYFERKEAINHAFHSKKFRRRYENLIDWVPTWIVYTEKELMEIYDKVVSQGHEGVIIRILGEPYQNKRSKFLLKLKPVDDAEYKVVEIKPGTGNWAGVAKIVTCQRIDGKFFDDGTDTFDATFKGTYEEAKHCLEHSGEFINKIATIYFNGYTGYGKPNYAQFDINNWEKGN